MAKAKTVQHRHEPYSCQTRRDTAPACPSGQQPQPDADIYSLVEDSDYVPPEKPPQGASKPRAAAEEDAPLKSRIALGYLKVNGREEPVFAPIQGFEHLFAHEPVAAPWPQPTATKTVAAPPAPPPSRKPRSRKRQHARSPQSDEAHDGDQENDPVSPARANRTFTIGDVESLKAFYAVRFRELTMKPMRDMVTAWVKRLEPRRQQKYGPYQRYEFKDRTYRRQPRSADKAKSIRPPWWPADVPYVEPSHLKLQHLVPLAVDIMLIHRRIDEEIGKRKYSSWISKLETDAVYLISSKDTDHFSSSRGAKYNEAMKTRALEVILPSLFDIAKSHEDYITQYDLFEGSGNQDPGCGKQVSWQPTPRPERRLNFKRPRTSTRVEVKNEDDGDDTEIDEDFNEPASVYSSFGSTAFSYTEDVKMFPDSDTREHSPALEVDASQAHPLFQVPAQSSMANVFPNVNHSVGPLHLYEGTPAKTRPAFSMNPTTSGADPHYSNGLSYGFPSYPGIPHVPYYMDASTGFATCGPVAPHHVDLARTNMTSGLPDNEQMQGSRMPGREYPPTHGIPLMDWSTDF